MMYFIKKIVSSTHHTMLKRLNNLTLLKFLILLILTCATNKNIHRMCSNNNFHPSHYIISTESSSFSILKLGLTGYIKTQNMDYAAKDFGNIKHFLPSAVLHPSSVSDISSIIKHVYEMGTDSELTVAARGHGHSLQGQAQAYRGIVVFMESLGGRMEEMHFNHHYVDVSAGELWIDVLRESLKRGFSPKSWTDYLHLTVGGTLSNAGISGQAFRHGPQISNVYQLEVVTGKGEVVICSENEKADLFYGVLGGLGQFGIITRARISIEPAPTMVKWIRILYEDFSMFTNDQEHLISSEKTFDYIEGFVIINRTGVLNSWKSSLFNPQYPQEASEFVSEGKTLFCIEVAKYIFLNDDDNNDDLVIRSLLNELNYIKSTLFSSQVSYIEFLDRVHVSELKLQEKGLWDIPHPWLNLLIPKRSIHGFARGVFGNIVKKMNNGPILIYPVNRSKWNNINRTSMVIPEGDIFYLVGFLSSVIPSSNEKEELDYLLRQNRKILEFCENENLGVKQYLSHYSTQKEWKKHFGDKWDLFSKRKFTYDPLAILAPGQRIFQKTTTTTTTHDLSL